MLRYEVHPNSDVTQTCTDLDAMQRVVHKSTSDMYDWSAELNDIAFFDYKARPGMATIAKSEYSGKYVMAFEYCAAPQGGCPVYYKIADSPLEFYHAQTRLIKPFDIKLNPEGSPYITWVPAIPGAPADNQGGGLFIMSSGSKESVYINEDFVDPNGWRTVDVGQSAAYSRSLLLVNGPGDEINLLLANGGNIGCSGSCHNVVATGLVNIPNYDTVGEGDMHELADEYNVEYDQSEENE